MNDEKKVVFVIPAYNEEKNIGRVIDEIEQDFKEADVVVINDCSKDSTRKVVLSKNVKCIDHLFNMGYAMAVQTGIKYAKYKNYDYVIQFDADGQHVAKEAVKLYQKMKEDNCDIVIGSRYLKEGSYKQKFFRKIGTVMFTKLIKIFCKKYISDPLSGMQCLSKKAIDRFSKTGMYPEFPDANLIIELLYDGYKIEEVPVYMRQRVYGVSMHSGILKPIKYMFQVTYTIIIILLRNTFRKKVK